MKNPKSTVLPNFSDIHIAVIGDVMIDRYVLGKVSRISPEAPVPILDWDKTENRLGGAANVALNIHELGANVSLFSVIGNDDNGDLLTDLLNSYSNISCELIQEKNRKTTVKTRCISKNQQLFRIDSEDKYDISEDTTEKLIRQLKVTHQKRPLQGIILQDYNKGVLTEKNIPEIIHFANTHNIPTFVDPKEKNFFAYKNCTLFKPNKKEITQALNGAWHEDYHKIDALLRQKINNKITLITLSSQGLFISDNTEAMLVPTSVRNISDVSGAGDTVISIVSLCYIQRMSINQIGLIANVAGGQVCQKPGVVPINLHQLNEVLENLNNKI